MRCDLTVENLMATVEMLPNQRAQAEVLSIGLTVGYPKVADAVAWADRIIADDPSPDLTVIDISMSGSRTNDDIISLLQGVPGGFDNVEVIRTAMAQMLAAIDNVPSYATAIALCLKRMAHAGRLPESPFGGNAYSFDEDFYLAREGICGSEAAVRQDLRNYLASHAAPEPLSG